MMIPQMKRESEPSNFGHLHQNLLFNWLKHLKSRKLSKIMTYFSLPAFYLIVNLVYDLILIQNRDQDQACAPRLEIISHQNSMSTTVMKNKT